MAERRARAEEFAGRINRAVELLALGSRPAVVRSVLEREYSLSARQALRYVRAAQVAPEGVAVPESTATFTVRLPVSVIAAARAGASRRGQGDRGADGRGASWSPHARGSIPGWLCGLRSAMSAIGSPMRGSRGPTVSVFLSVAALAPRQPRR